MTQFLNFKKLNYILIQNLTAYIANITYVTFSMFSINFKLFKFYKHRQILRLNKLD